MWIFWRFLFFNPSDIIGETGGQLYHVYISLNELYSLEIYLVYTSENMYFFVCLFQIENKILNRQLKKCFKMV